jgi:hypothetical protein
VPQVVEEGFGVSTQLLVPLQVEVMQAVDVQVTVVPVQLPLKQASLKVHRFPSSHPTDVRQAQVPPEFVQRYVVPPQVMTWHTSWLAALHVCTVPPLHSPSALFAPQPWQVSPRMSWFAVQVSAQAPFVVRQPPVAALHDDAQHSLAAPTPQVVVVAEHEQELHTSPVPLQYRVQVPG